MRHSAIALRLPSVVRSPRFQHFSAPYFTRHSTQLHRLCRLISAVVEQPPSLMKHEVQALEKSSRARTRSQVHGSISSPEDHSCRVKIVSATAMTLQCNTGLNVSHKVEVSHDRNRFRASTGTPRTTPQIKSPCGRMNFPPLRGRQSTNGNDVAIVCTIPKNLSKVTVKTNCHNRSKNVKYANLRRRFRGAQRTQVWRIAILNTVLPTKARNESAATILPEN